MITSHLYALKKNLDLYSSSYEKTLTLRDFNVGIGEQRIKSFCKNSNLTNLIKQPTCYKNPDSPTCIGLILSHLTRSFLSTYAIDRLSHFHLMTLNVMNKSFKKNQTQDCKL